MTPLYSLNQDLRQNHDGILIDNYFNQNNLLFSATTTDRQNSTQAIGVIHQIINFEGIGDTLISEQLIYLGNTFKKFDNTLGNYQLRFFPAQWLRDLSLTINTVPSVLTPTGSYNPNPTSYLGDSKSNPVIFNLVDIGNTLSYANTGHLSNVWVKVGNTNHLGFKVDSIPSLTIGVESLDGATVDDTSGFAEIYLNVPAAGNDFALTFNTVATTQGIAREYPFTATISSLPDSKTVDITGLGAAYVRFNNPSLLPVTITSDAGGFDYISFDGQSVITDTTGLASFYGVFYSFTGSSLTINFA